MRASSVAAIVTRSSSDLPSCGILPRRSALTRSIASSCPAIMAFSSFAAGATMRPASSCPVRSARNKELSNVLSMGLPVWMGESVVMMRSSEIRMYSTKSRKLRLRRSPVCFFRNLTPLRPESERRTALMFSWLSTECLALSTIPGVVGETAVAATLYCLMSPPPP
jgi:hypothetical protein